MENEARNDCFKKNKIIYYVKWVESMTKKSYEERMDSTDAKIIEILQDNGRISMKDLGAVKRPKLYQVIRLSSILTLWVGL